MREETAIPAEGRRKILVVEDEMIVAMAEAEVIQCHGYEAVTASCGEEAIDMIQADPSIGLVLMDIDLGSGMDGTEAARQILAIRQVPIVFLTSHAEREMVEKVRGITRYGYVLKESGDFVLLSSIEMAFELVEAHRATEQKEEALNRVNERFEMAQAAAGVGVWDWDTATGHLAWTPPMFTLFGLDPERDTATFETWRETLHPEDRESAELRIIQALNDRVTLYNEYRVVWPDGEVHWIYAQGKGIYDDEGRPKRMLGTCMDITERRGMEKELAGHRDHLEELVEERARQLEESHQTLKAIMDYIPEGITIARGPEARITMMSRYGQELTGIPLEPHMEAPYQEHPLIWNGLQGDGVTPAAPEELPLARAAMKGEVSINEEWAMRRPDGKTLIMLCNAGPIRSEEGELLGGIITWHDITGRREMEEALRRQHEEIELLYRTAPVGLCLIDRELRYVRINERLAEINGIPAGEHIGRTIREILPHLADQTEPVLRRILETGTPVLEFELTGETPAQPGVQRSWVNSWLPVRDRAGAVFGISVVAEETTRRRQMEKELEHYRVHLQEMVKERTRQVEEMNEALDRTNRKLGESEELFRGVFEKSPIGIAIADSVTQRFIRANRSFCELTGYTADELAGMPIESIAHPEDRQAEDDSIRDYCMNPAKPFKMEKRYIRRDGEIRLVSLTGNYIDVPGGGPPLALGNVVYITEHRRAEEEIRRLLAEKELLLKEVHHRLRNNMNAAMSLLLLQSKRMKDPAAVEALVDARNRMQSMGALYDRLYRSESFNEMKIGDYLPSLIKEIVSMFPHKEAVTIETEMADFLLSAKILSPLGIIVNELVTNSMKYAFIGRDRGLIRASASLKDNRVTLIYEDNGIGIPESVGFDGSTGFGLQLIALLTRQLKGDIRLERHQGTRFTLEFDIC